MKLKSRETAETILAVILMIVLYKFVNRDSLIGVVNEALPGREAALLNGMVWGDKSGISRTSWQEMTNAGLIHLVVVSGSTVLLLSKGLIEASAGLLGRKKAIILGMAGIWFYAGVAGWQIPVVRAGVFLMLLYTAQLLGRKFDKWRGLTAGMLIIIAADYEVLKSVSFWLSVTAFAAVLAYKGSREGSSQIKENIRQSVWVGLWISPILAASFGELSLISPLTNVAVVGIMEITMALGMIGGVAGCFWKELGQIIVMAGYPMLRMFEAISETSGRVEMIKISWNWELTAGVYAILGWWTAKQRKKSEV
ncbi:MAG TPA: ComEC/Rec2 family competence protein [Patescibacteria group bacterium]